MGRVPIPKPSFLDRCEPLGYIYGERRWRDADGRILTWDGLHGEIEVFDKRGRHRGVIDPVTGENRKLALKGEPFVSDVAQKRDTFFALYDSGHAVAGDIDDFVGAWHESGDEETRSLVEYLGLTAEEYGVLMLTDRTLPVILAARRANRPLREFVAPFFEQLQADGNPKDASVLFAMGHWLKKHQPE